MFDTKISVVLRDDLQTWQKLNVTAFLMSGIVADSPEIIGESYEDSEENSFNAMSSQPLIVLASDGNTLSKIHQRALGRGVKTSVYIEEMFETGHDGANRAAFRQFSPDSAKVVGVALRADKKIVDKITKGAKMHT